MKNLDLLLEAAYAVREKVEEGVCGLEMSWWNTHNGEEIFIKRGDRGKPYCGTSACFAGHMPFLGIPELSIQEEDFGLNHFSYTKYILRIFNIHSGDDMDAWEWLFSALMGNDIDLLVRRVEYFCKHKSPPPEDQWAEFGYVFE